MAFEDGRMLVPLGREQVDQEFKALVPPDSHHRSSSEDFRRWHFEWLDHEAWVGQGGHGIGLSHSNRLFVQRLGRRDCSLVGVSFLRGLR